MLGRRSTAVPTAVAVVGVDGNTVTGTALRPVSVIVTGFGITVAVFVGLASYGVFHRLIEVVHYRDRQRCEGVSAEAACPAEPLVQAAVGLQLGVTGLDHESSVVGHLPVWGAPRRFLPKVQLLDIDTD